MGRDYTVSYADNTAAGDATVTLEGIGNYAGKRTLTFTIGKRALEDEFIAAIADQTYTGGELTPAADRHLQRQFARPRHRLHRIVRQQRRRDAKERICTASVIIEGMGNYAGSASASFTILPKKYHCGRRGHRPTRRAHLHGRRTHPRTRHHLQQHDARSRRREGLYRRLRRQHRRRHGDRRPHGHRQLYGLCGGFLHHPRSKDISAEDVAVASIDPLTYTGGELTPVPVITYNGMTLVVGAENDFTVAYENNTDATQRAARRRPSSSRASATIRAGRRYPSPSRRARSKMSSSPPSQTRRTRARR